MFAGFKFTPDSFPPTQAVDGVGVAVFIGLFLLICMATFGILLTLHRRSRVLDLAIWPIVLAIAFWLASLCDPEDAARRLTQANLAVIYLVSVVGVVICTIRLVAKSGGSKRSGIAVILGVVALWIWSVFFVPEVANVRAAARRTDCKNRMRQIAIAMHDWNDKFGRLPDLTISEGTNPPRTWRVEILSFMEGDNIREGYRKDRKWDDNENFPIAKLNLRDFRCGSAKGPNQHDVSGRYYAHYLAVTGPNTIFANGKGMTLDAVSKADGTSKTLLLVEASGRNIVWTEPRDADTAIQPIGINLPGKDVLNSPSLLSTYHRAGANVSMADASVHTVPKDIDPKILKALTTTNGNDPADRGF